MLIIHHDDDDVDPNILSVQWCHKIFNRLMRPANMEINESRSSFQKVLKALNNKVKLVTLVEVDPKALFSIANQAIGLMSREFTNGPGDWVSISGWVIPKTQKMVLDTALLRTQHYKVRIKGKVVQSREWSNTLSTPWCSCYCKESLQVILDLGCQLYF